MQTTSRIIQDIYPLSPMQQGMLFHSLFAPDKGMYIEQVNIGMRGNLNMSLFEEAWNHVLHHFSVLRTAFLWDEIDKPLQVVYQKVTIPFSFYDWRAWTPEQQQEHLTAFLQADRARGFDLSEVPLMRLCCIQIQNNIYQFIWSHHHILVDGWSLPIILSSVFSCYEMLCRKEAIYLAPTRPYRDYISWLKRQDTGKADAYWHQLLKGFTAPTPLGIDHPPTQESGYDECIIPLSVDLTQRLQSMVRQHHITLNTALQGAWALLLSCYSNQDDVIFGSVVSGRPTEITGIESMVGLFINTLPVRVRLNPAQKLLSWLHHLQFQLTELRQYEYSPLAQVQKHSDVQHGTPLFESILAFENYPLAQATAQQQTQTKLELLGGHTDEQTNYPLTLTIIPGQQLILKLQSERSRFDSVAIKHMLAHLQSLLESMVHNPDQCLGMFSPLTPTERQQMLVEWNDTYEECTYSPYVHELFEAQVKRTPTSIAAKFRGESLTYHQLNARANQLAHWLQQNGVGPEVLVGICMNRSLDMLIAILGVLKAGGAYLPLDPGYPSERLSFILKESRAPVLLTLTHNLSVLPAHTGQVICLDRDWEQFSEQSQENMTRVQQPEQLAYVIYTSGSTGKPKGVMIHHQGLLNYLHWSCNTYEVATGTGALIHSSISFDLTVTSIFTPLLTGRTVELLNPDLDIEALSTTVEQAENMSLLKITPSHLEILNQTLTGETLAGRARALVIGGEALQSELLSFWQTYAPDTRLFNEYGPTETAVGCCIYEVSTRKPAHTGAVPIGHPIINMQAYVLDSNYQPVPVGVAGELCIGGIGLGRGYLQRPNLTAEKFVPHPWSIQPGARLYKTGDRARYRADGTLEYLGRLDLQVKIRGYRIELGEIESIIKQLPGIRECAVLAHKDKNDTKRLIAYVTTDQSDRATEQVLHTGLSQQVPAYMLPSAFIFMDTLPLTPNGKIDRLALPAPDYTHIGNEQVYVAPRTSAEQTLAEIWSNTLGIEKVGVHDNFFTLGGDSILCIRVVAQARQAGLYITPRQVFQFPTIAGLANVLTQTDTSPTVVAEQGMVFGPVTLTPIQHWFFAQKHVEPYLSSHTLLLTTQHPLSPAHLKQAVAYLLIHHDALRLRFHETEDGWQQTNAIVDAQVPFEMIDLSSLPLESQNSSIAEHIARMRTHLSLAKGPLIRMAYFDTGTSSAHKLAIVIHDLVVDEQSWHILLADLCTFYTQIHQGQYIKLPAKTTSYQQWAHFLREYAQKPEIQDEMAYWLDFAQQRCFLLPTDIDLSTHDAATQAYHTVETALSEEETLALLYQVPTTYHLQIQDILLTALVQTLSDWLGYHSYMIGFEDGRRYSANVDLSHTVGRITNLYPLLLSLEGIQTIAEGLKTTKERLRAASRHSLSYGLLRYFNLDEDDEDGEDGEDTVQAPIPAMTDPQLLFRYLGQFDLVPSGTMLFHTETQDYSLNINYPKASQYLLEISASISNRQLRMQWIYNEQQYCQTTIENLAQNYQQNVRRLIAHCQLPDVGGYTPSDFPLAGLSQAQIDTLLSHDRHIEAIYPLSPLQTGLLFQSLYAPESGDYIVQFNTIFQGHVHCNFFIQAWQQVIEHNAVLRTSFIWDGLDEPLQIVHHQISIPFATDDWRAYSLAEQQARLLTYLEDDRTRGFDLTQSPLMRFRLIQLTDDSYQFIWSHHHILLDGWSLPLVLKNVFICYEALCQGNSAQLQSVRPYQDYIAWLAQHQNKEQAEHFWRNTLQGITTPTLLGIEHTQTQPTSRIHSYRDNSQQLSVNATNALQKMARTYQLTLNTIIQGAWALLLSRYSGQQDVVFGTTVSGRPTDIDDIESMVGLFVNALPICVHIRPELSMVTWLQELQTQQSEMRQHEYTPLVQVQAWSQVPHGIPLFENLFIFENFPMDIASPLPSTEDGLKILGGHTSGQTSYPLTITVFPGSQLMTLMSYDTARFEDTAITRLQAHFHHLLTTLIAMPEQAVANLNILSPQELEYLIHTVNTSLMPLPAVVGLHQLIEMQANRTPAATALHCEQFSLSYHDLNRQANQLASYLREMGIGPDVLVGVYVERSPEMVVALLAILKAGGAYVPLDPTYPIERIAFMLSDAQVAVLLTQQRLLSHLPPFHAPIFCLDRDWHLLIDEHLAHTPTCRVQLENLAYVIYTSGSTGQPKGVQITHGNVINFFTGMDARLDYQEGDIWLALTSISFDISVLELFWTLSHGFEVIIHTETEIGLSLPSHLAHTHITHLQCTPSWLRAFMEHDTSNKQLNGIRHLLVGGEALPLTLAQQVGAHITGSLHNMYGPTETTIWSTSAQLDTIPDQVTLGQPIANTQIYLLDSQLHLVPQGIAGDLYIGGLGIARGYLHRPDLTAERFIADPFSLTPGARLYKTGDLARYHQNGQLEYLGRSDLQIKLHGYRIELGEIEHALLLHPLVRQAAVIAQTAQTEEMRLLAYVVLASEAQIKNQDLRQYIQTRLPTYMVPSSFIQLEALPMTPNGKLDRKALPAPDTNQTIREQPFVAPQTATEQLLAQIWGDVLHIEPVEQIGIHDNFFSLGGDSILSIRVVSHAKQAGIQLTPRLLFQYPTIAALASNVTLSDTPFTSVTEQDLVARPTHSDFSLARLSQEQIDRLQRPDRPLQAIYPLSPLQQGLLFHSLYTPDSGDYIIQINFLLQGSFQPWALLQAWQQVIERYDLLRTSFVWEGIDEPHQIVQQQVALPLTSQDWRMYPPAEQQARLAAYLQQDRIQGFSLAQAPLMRFLLIQTADDCYQFIWSYHHILLDGWSIPIINREVFSVYQALVEGDTLPLHSVRPYQDYIAWLAQQDLQQAEHFWRQTLQGVTAPTPLGIDHPSTATHQYEEKHLSLSGELTEALQQLARMHGLTFNTIVQGIWALLLSHYSGQQDIIFGTTLSGRPADIDGVEAMVGLFVNVLPIRVHIQPEATLISWLQTLQTQYSEMRQYEYTPLVHVQNWSQVPRGTPLFESLFTFENYPLGSIPTRENENEWSEETPLMVKMGYVAGQTSYPLNITAIPGPQLTLLLQYDHGRIETAAIERLLDHMHTLLAAAADQPNQPLVTLPLLTTTERAQILHIWNNTQVPFPHTETQPDLFEAQVARTPNQLALRFERQDLTYAELNRCANQLAHHLQTLGVGPDVLVGIHMERSLQLIIAIYAVLKAGGAYVPLEPSYPADRLSFMLTDAQISILLTQTHLLDRLPTSDTPLTTICVDQPWNQFASQPTSNPPRTLQSAHLAYAIYTSGSTGQPKGTMNTHIGLCNRLRWMQDAYPLNASDRVLQKTPFSFDVSVWEICWPLLYGASLVIARPDGHQDSAYLLKLIEQEQITTIHFVPSMLQVFLEEPDLPTCHNLRQVICSGEALPFELQDRFFSRLSARLYNLYGPTEAAIDVSAWQCIPGQTTRIVPIGTPISNIQLYILDPYFQPVPIGVAGELHIGGLGLGRGYLRRADLTAEKFAPHPWSSEPGMRLYKTGDRARYLPNGAIEYLGRLDHQVKLRGFRIELGEIESVLAQQDGVRECAVIARENVTGQTQLIAFVVANLPPHEQALRQALQARLPEYMVPSTFVFLKSLPLSPNGKMDRKALQRSNEGQAIHKQSFVAPRTATEQILTQIWGDVLHTEQIGIHDNFFSLGGDSILSIRVVSRARQAGIHLTPRLLFQYPTIATLASIVTINDTPVISTIEQGLISGPAPLTPIQHWFFEQQQPYPHYWNQSLFLKTDHPLHTATLIDAVARLLMHHDALRLRFVATPTGWQQHHTPWDGLVPVSVFDLSSISSTQHTQAIEEIAALVQASLDLEHGPLIRVVSFHLGTQASARLLLVIHHLIVDQVSWDILLSDLQHLYTHLLQGKTIQLPAKTSSFQHWAQSLHTYAQSQEVTQHLSYWLTLHTTTSASLPIDHHYAENTVASTRYVLVSLPMHETQALLHEVPSAYHTQINEVLLTALAYALSAWTGQDAHIVDIEGHGREDILDGVDLSRTIGWFTALYPVSLDLTKSNHISHALKTIKEQLRRIPQHGLSYGLLRYLYTADPEEDEYALIQQLRAQPAAPLNFNYLGQLNLDNKQSSGLFSPASEAYGPPRSPLGMRTHLLEVNCHISGGQLHMAWAFSENRHQRTTIERLAQEYMQALRMLIAHCQQPTAGGYTPSDFPLALLSQDHIDRLLGHDHQVQTIYPLSPLQQGLLFHSLYTPNSGDYIIQIGFLIQGSFHPWALIQAWQQVIERYDLLRTSFVWEEIDEPHQIVRQQVALPFTSEDWRIYPPAEQQARLDAYLQQDRIQGFSLTQAPLMRFLLIQTADDCYQFIWSYHHILLDGWSVPIVNREVFAIYQALVQGDPPPSYPVRPYQDYIAWLAQQDLRQAEDFWRQALRGVTAPTPLGIDHTTTATINRQYEEKILSLSEELTEALQQLARTHGLTLNTIIQGIWALLLSHYSGLQDVIFGVTVAGRSADIDGIELMVGLFINTLPRRIHIDPQTILLSWLQELHNQQSEMHQYEYSSLVQVQTWSEIPHGIPLFESLLVFENYPLDDIAQAQDIPEGSVNRARLDVHALYTQEQTHYPLTITANPGSQLTFTVQYASDRFETTAIDRLLGHIHTLLAAAIDQPNQPLVTLPLLTTTEHAQILHIWNNTQVPFPRTETQPDLFEAQVARTPEHLAVRFEGQDLTYAKLNRTANQLAHHLQTLGVGPDVLVGICMERSFQLIIAVYAVLKAGGAYVPLEPSYPANRLSFMLTDARISILLTQTDLLDRWPTSDLSLTTICIDQPEEQFASQPTSNPPRMLQPAHLAYITYTSGSTGRPKGTMNTHAGLCNHMHWIQQSHPLSSSDRVLQKTPISFDDSISEFFWPLFYGASLVIARPDGHKDSAYLLKLIEQEQITMINFVPSMLQVFLEEPNLQTCHSLRLVTSGGEALPFELQERFFSRLTAKLYNLYGPTEAAIDSSIWHCVQGQTSRVVPIGTPISNVQLYILDPYYQPVPIGVAGELHIGGLGLGRGYLQRADLTAEKFVPHPWSTEPGMRLYKTGDRARSLPNGAIEYLGRLDHQVKLRGFRIELGEIESALSQQHGVRECVVIAREDTPGQKRLVAYIVVSQPEIVSEQELRLALQAQFPEYMVPAAFVFLNSLPLLSNGKVNRQILPMPTNSHLALTNESVPPRDHIETQLVQIWEALLDTHPIGIRDNFFALGGHSILAIQLVNLIRRDFGQNLTLSLLFQQPTIEQLATTLRHQVVTEAPSTIVAIQPAGSKTPFFCVHPVGGNVFCYIELATHMGLDQPFYGLQSVGLYGEQEPYTTIEDMASHYITAIQSIQPEGPYLLGGWSMGGVIAFEMAQQLQKKGQQVRLLALIDSSAPTVGKTEVNTDEETLVLVHTILQQVGETLKISNEDLCDLTPDERLYYVLEQARKIEKENLPTEVSELALPQTAQLMLVNKYNLQADANYRPQTYSQRLTLLRAREQTEEKQPDAYVNAPQLWSQLTTGGIDIHQIPGNHITIMQMPLVQNLAIILKTCIEQALQSEEH